MADSDEPGFWNKFITSLAENGGNILGAGLSAGISYLANRQSNKSALAMQEQNNQFNQQQYEDWKFYNSLSEQVKRAKAAGVNPYHLSLDNNLPSAYQRNNSVSEEPTFSSLSKAFGKGFASYMSLKDKQLQKKQMEFNEKYKEELLDFQKTQLDSLEEYRKSVLEQGATKLYLQGQKNQVDTAYRNALLAFKRDFYTNEDYLGYWSVRNSKQKYNHDFEMNPVLLDIAKNKRTQGSVFNKHFEDYLNAQISGMSARAVLGQLQADKANALYDADLAYNQAYLNARRAQEGWNASGFGRAWNIGIGMLNDASNVAGKIMGIFGKGRFGSNIPTPPAYSMPYNSYHYTSY